MNPIEYDDEIGNEMLGKKKNLEVCEAWYSVALYVLEEPYNAMPSRIADLIKAKGIATMF